jgi:hypothetical protein
LFPTPPRRRGLRPQLEQSTMPPSASSHGDAIGEDKDKDFFKFLICFHLSPPLPAS